MCYKDCFLYFFTIRAGSTCTSAFLLAFGVIGIILVPLLPFSGNSLQFNLIMGYMILVVIAFTIALCGSITDSRITVCVGLALGIAAFIIWLGLTIPSFLYFRKTSVNDFCLGLSCGESHWLVPRQWNDTEFTNLTKKNENDRKKQRNYSDRLQELDQNEMLDSIVKSSSRFQPEDDLKGAQGKSTTIPAYSKGSNNDKEDIDEDYDQLLTENQETSTIIHSLIKRQINGKPSRFIIPLFISNGHSFLKVNRLQSYILAVLYGLLYACVLGTICMNLISFAGSPKECTDCEKMIRMVPCKKGWKKSFCM